MGICIQECVYTTVCVSAGVHMCIVVCVSADVHTCIAVYVSAGVHLCTGVCVCRYEHTIVEGRTGPEGS